MYLLHLAIIIWLLPLFAFVIQIFFGNRLPRKGDWLIVGSMFVDMALALIIFFNVLLRNDPDFKISLSFDWIILGTQNFPLGFTLDNVTAVMLVFVTVVSALVFLYSTEYMKGDPLYSRYFAYLSLFAFSMLGLILFDNLLGIYICWELVGLCSYLLIGFWFEKDSASNAGKKAFITNRVGDFGMFIGMLLVYFAVGTFSLDEIQQAVVSGSFNGTMLSAEGIRLCVEAGGKSAQAPLPVLLPGAMDGATPVSALIRAATMVVAGVYLVVRIFFMLTPDSALVIAYIGGFTALFAASIALVQNDIKRVLAYSTVSQLGYMMLALGTVAYAAGLFHLMTHAFFKALLFLGSGSVIHSMEHAFHSKKIKADPQDMVNMGGLRRKMPVTFWTFLIATVSISGVPFTSGFLSKDAILAGTLSFAGSNPQHFLLPLFGFTAAGLTAFYMFRLVFKTFFGEFKFSKAWNSVHESGKAMLIPLILLSVLSLFMFYSFSPVSPEDGWFYHLIQKPEQAAMVNVMTVEASGNHAEVPHDSSHAYALVLSLIVAGTGILIAYRTYYSGKISAVELGNMYPNLYKAMFNKWYIDEFYHATIIKSVLLWSSYCKWFDNTIIDGAVNGTVRITVYVSWFKGKFDNIVVDGLVNGVANVTLLCGRFTQQVQTGKIQQYLVGLLAALIVIIILRAI